MAGSYGDLTVHRLAGQCGVSDGYLRKLFQAGLGEGPHCYLQHLRLEMARHLLQTTRKSVLNVSEEVGFQSVSTMNRLFANTSVARQEKSAAWGCKIRTDCYNNRRKQRKGA